MSENQLSFLIVEICLGKGSTKKVVTESRSERVLTEFMPLLASARGFVRIGLIHVRYGFFLYGSFSPRRACSCESRVFGRVMTTRYSASASVRLPARSSTCAARR
jgi:hypothetical protein